MGVLSNVRTSSRSMSDRVPLDIRLVDEKKGEAAMQQWAATSGSKRPEDTTTAIRTKYPSWGGEQEHRQESTGCVDDDHNELESYAERIIQVIGNSRTREREQDVIRRRAVSDAEQVHDRVSRVIGDLRKQFEVELVMRRELEEQLFVVRDQLTKLGNGVGKDLHRNFEDEESKELEQERARDRGELEQELSILRHHNTELTREGEALRTELEDKKAAISILEELYVKTLSILHFISAKRESERDAARKELRENKIRLDELRVLNRNLKSEGDAVRSELHDTQKAFLIVCERNKRLKIGRDSALGEVQEQKAALLIVQERHTKLESEYDTARRELQHERLQMHKLLSRRDSMKRELDEEREKNLCQICLENPRDTLSLPCVHLHYCFACLQEHHVRSKTCPTCRSPTSGVLKCTVSME